MDLNAIEQRANAATGGPWDLISGTIAARVLGAGGQQIALFATDDDPDAMWNAQFITSARTDVPALVARVRELEEELDDTIEVRNAQLVEVNRQRNDLMARARGLEAENKRLREALQDMDARTTATARREQAAQRARIAGW